MIARRPVVVLSCLVTCLIASATVACSSVERSDAGDTAGATGEAGGPTSQGGTSSDSGSGGDDGTAGSTAIAGTSGSMGGTSAGGDGTTAGSSGDGSMAGSSSGGSSAAGSAGSAGSAGTAGSGPTGPMFMNPSFELGGLTGWDVTVTPSSVARAIFTQAPSDGGTPAGGAEEVGFWNGMYAFTGDLHQTITGITPGKYSLTTWVDYGTGLNKAYIYAIDCGTMPLQVDLPIPPTQTGFHAVSIPEIDVVGDSCTIGLYADMHIGDWLNADDFSFDPVTN